MRVIISLFLLISFSILFITCQKGGTGPAGPAGATGAQGPAGPAGGQGPKGDTGAANVAYSKWMPVTAASWFVDSTVYRTHRAQIYDTVQKIYVTQTYADTFIFYHSTLSTPKLTQEILDKGLLYYYVKDSTTPRNGNTMLFNGADVGVTNRQQSVLWINPFDRYLFNLQHNYGVMFVPQTGFNIRFADNGITKDSLKLATFWAGSSIAYDPGRQEYTYTLQSHGTIQYAELPPRTQFYIRYVVVPGTTSSGRGLQLNYQEYNSVRNYYHLPD